MNLPVVELVINPDETAESEVSFVALVDKPAIERNFLAFKDNKLLFAVNDEKRIISGPAMVPDQLIYRKDENGEYNVFFSAETLREIAIKFFKKDYQKNLNLFHDPSLSLEGVTIFESFVTDAARGIQPMKGFEDLPDGTWFISAKVENDEVWNKIKAGEVKGFSVEGIFTFVKPQNRPTKQFSGFESETFIMSEIKDLWAKFKEKFLGEPTQPENKFMDAKLKDGTAIQVDKLEVGGVVMIGEAPAPAGEHELEDGTKIVVGEGGVITEVKPAEAPMESGQNPTDYDSQFSALNEKLTKYETDFASHVQAFSAMAQEFASTKEAFNAAQVKLNELVNLVAKIVETPTEESKVEPEKFNSQKPSRKDTIAKFYQTLQSLKNK